MATTRAVLRMTRCALRSSSLLLSRPSSDLIIHPNRQILFYTSLSHTTGNTKTLPNSEINPEEKDAFTPVIIYDGPLTEQLRRVKLFSLSTSGMGLVLQPKIIMQTMEAEASLAAGIAALGLIGFFTYVTPLMIHYLAKRYVTAMTFNPETDSYTATTYSFFLQKREHTFKIEDVTVPELPGMFTTLLVKSSKGNKNIPLFLSDSAFTEPLHYGRMMGYDKPMDFHLGEAVDEALASKHEKSKIK